MKSRSERVQQIHQRLSFELIIIYHHFVFCEIVNTQVSSHPDRPKCAMGNYCLKLIEQIGCRPERVEAVPSAWMRPHCCPYGLSECKSNVGILALLLHQ